MGIASFSVHEELHVQVYKSKTFSRKSIRMMSCLPLNFISCFRMLISVSLQLLTFLQACVVHEKAYSMARNVQTCLVSIR